jgi:membrane-bound serine protease (ClpP class)
MKGAAHVLLTILFCTLILPLPAAAQEAAEPAEAAAPDEGRAALVRLEGEISPFRTVFVRRAIERAREAEVNTIIFALNTFGGRVDSALQIATLIGSLDEIRTVAYIPAESESTGVSWSAGALISFSCNAIYMAPGTSIGAAAPVFQSSEGTQAAGEKTVSAVRAQMAALAEKNGYPPEVAVAMVDQDAELRVVEEEGSYRFYIAGRGAPEEAVAEEDKTARVISPEGKLLALTAGEMERYRISSGTFGSTEELARRMDTTIVTEIAPNRADRTVSFLTSAGFTSILLTIGLLALYLEVSSPGFGVPGAVAITAFAVIFLSSGLLGTLGSLELLLFLFGVVLLAAEVFLIPGFGVTGILGLASMGIGLLLSRQTFFLPDSPWQWDIFLTNITVVFGTIAASFLLMGVLMIFFPRIRLFRRLILSSSEADYHAGASSPSLRTAAAAGSGGGAPAGGSSNQASGSGTQTAESGGERELEGARGKALTELRPTGRAEIAGEFYPVVSEGRWIERGATLRVVRVEGNRIIVEEE